MAETSLKDDSVVMAETIDYIKYISMLRLNRSAGMMGAVVTMNTTQRAIANVTP